MNGAAKLATPIAMLSLKYRRRMVGSISAPAMKVRRMLPKPARNLIHSFDSRCQCKPKT